MEETQTLYIMEADEREIAAEMRNSRIIEIRNVAAVMIVAIITAAIVVLGLILLGVPWLLVGCAAGIMLYRTIYWIEPIVAIAVRTPVLYRIAKIAHMVLLQLCTIMYYGKLRMITYDTNRRAILKRIDEHMIPIDKLDAKMTPWRKMKISPYWESRGLNVAKLSKQTKMVRISAEDPLRPVSDNPKVMDVREFLPNKIWITRRAESWATSDMTDEMHVKSLYKRVAGVRYPLNENQQRRMIATMLESLEILSPMHIEDGDAIMRALSSKGSAGQFAKRSKMEDMWKDKGSKIAIEIWALLTNRVRKTVMLTARYPQTYVQYMLYRKKEPLQIEDGHIKVTRIMNAPNLVARVTDSKPFVPFNDALARHRWDLCLKIGMNIFVELKFILYYNPHYDIILTDFADYDGTQHAVQMYACALARLDYAMRCGHKLEDMNYLLPRYERHIHRNVKSTFGITYDTIGQLASGDITTTDDNSIKSEAQAIMATEDLYEEARKRGYKRGMKEMTPMVSIMSDDSARVIRRDILDSKTIEEILTKTAAGIGWKIKEGSFEQHQMLQDGKAYFLSHSIRRRWYATRNLNCEICIPIVTREKSRAAGKWTIASELDSELSDINKAKLASKYLTTMMTSPGNPELLVSSMYMLLWLRCSVADVEGPYMWMGLQAKTIRAVTLARVLTMQTQIVMYQTHLTHIKLDEDEEEIIRYQISRMNELVEDYENGNLIRRSKSLKFKVDIIGQYWDYDAAIENLNAIMLELERSSHVKTKESHNKWWSESIYEAQTYEITHHREVLSCGHIHPRGMYAISEYETGVLCIDCWAIRREGPDKSINICMK